MPTRDLDYFTALYRQAAERRRADQARWQERQRVRWHPPPPLSPSDEEADDTEEPAA